MKKFIAVLIVLIICFGVFACSLYDPFDNTYDDIKNEVEGAFEDALHEFASPSPSTCASSHPLRQPWNPSRVSAQQPLLLVNRKNLFQLLNRRQSLPLNHKLQKSLQRLKKRKLR